jgi:hypothetical protein
MGVVPLLLQIAPATAADTTPVTGQVPAANATARIGSTVLAKTT